MKDTLTVYQERLKKNNDMLLSLAGHFIDRGYIVYTPKTKIELATGYGILLFTILFLIANL